MTYIISIKLKTDQINERMRQERRKKVSVWIFFFFLKKNRKWTRKETKRKNNGGLLPGSFPFRLKCIRLRTQLHKLHFLQPLIPLRSTTNHGKPSGKTHTKPSLCFAAKLSTPQLRLPEMTDSETNPAEETKSPVQKCRFFSDTSTSQILHASARPR